MHVTKNLSIAKGATIARAWTFCWAPQIQPITVGIYS